MDLNQLALVPVEPSDQSSVGQEPNSVRFISLIKDSDVPNREDLPEIVVITNSPNQSQVPLAHRRSYCKKKPSLVWNEEEGFLIQSLPAPLSPNLLSPTPAGKSFQCYALPRKYAFQLSFHFFVE